MPELDPPCRGAIEQRNADGTFRVRHPRYADQLFHGPLVRVGQYITITHASTAADQPWEVTHYVLELEEPPHRDP